MDRLIRIEPTNEVTIRLEQSQRSYGVFTLRNVMYTMPVAFRLLPLNRNRFSIRPQTGIIAPLATLTVEITYLSPLPPAPFLPDRAPESDDSFFLDSVVSPGASFKDGASATALDAVPADWFTAKKKQVFTDSALGIFYVGSAVLARLVDAGDMEKVREVLERSDLAWRAADSSDANCKGIGVFFMLPNSGKQAKAGTFLWTEKATVGHKIFQNGAPPSDPKRPLGYVW